MAVDPVIVLLGDPAATTDRPHVAAYFTAAHTNYARDYMTAAESVIPPLEEWFGAPRTQGRPGGTHRPERAAL